MSEYLAYCTTSRRRRDLEETTLALKEKPDIHQWVVLELWQYTGTNIVQWHGKRLDSVAWWPTGQVMQIKGNP